MTTPKSTDKAGVTLGKCRSCQEVILWASTKKNHKSIPLDPMPNPDGNVLLVATDAHTSAGRVVYEAVVMSDPMLFGTEDLYMPHHATCPQGGEWKR